MPHVFQCPSCSQQTVISTDAFNQRIIGHKVTLRCNCQACCGGRRWRAAV